MFSEKDYQIISDAVFHKNYPGYRPNVIESPDGDGKWDNDKRYAHIANKYLETYTHPYCRTLKEYLHQANEKAIQVAIKLGVPKEFWPVKQYSALRVLEYPPGAITNPHYDFDLFTLMCYRNVPEAFRYINPDERGGKLLLWANELNRQIHFGEILEFVIPAYKATRHEVIADPQDRTQYSIVYFAIPDHNAVLPNGITVEAWLAERMERSRKNVA